MEPARGGERPAQGVPQGRERRHRAQPRRPGIGDEPAVGRAGPRKGLRAGGRRRPVGQRGEHGQPADAVEECVVRDEDQADPSPGQVRHEHGGPQGPVRQQAPAGDRDGHVQERPLVPRLRTADVPDVPRRVEVRVVDPDRAAGARRQAHQPLPETRHGGRALGEEPPGRRRVEVRCPVEQQHGAQLLGKAAAGFDGPHAQVCLTGAFDGGAPHRRVGRRHGSHRPTGPLRRRPARRARPVAAGSPRRRRARAPAGRSRPP